MASPLAGAAVNETNVQNLKDIMMSYNRITEACFSRCISNLNSTEMKPLEEHCVNSCSGKFISGNQRIMTSFMQIQSAKQKAMFDDAEKEAKQQEAAQLAASATSAAVPTQDVNAGLQPPGDTSVALADSSMSGELSSGSTEGKSGMNSAAGLLFGQESPIQTAHQDATDASVLKPDSERS